MRPEIDQEKRKLASGFVGVHCYERNGTYCYRPVLLLEGGLKFLGSYNDPIVAAKVRETAIIEFKRNSARRNFPEMTEIDPTYHALLKASLEGKRARGKDQRPRKPYEQPRKLKTFKRRQVNPTEFSE